MRFSQRDLYNYIVFKKSLVKSQENGVLMRFGILHTLSSFLLNLYDDDDDVNIL